MEYKSTPVLNFIEQRFLEIAIRALDIKLFKSPKNILYIRVLQNIYCTLNLIFSELLI